MEAGGGDGMQGTVDSPWITLLRGGDTASEESGHKYDPGAHL